MASARELESRTLFAPAMKEYEEAIEENPNNAEAYYRIGPWPTNSAIRSLRPKSFVKP